MIKTANLASEIKKQLPAELVDFLHLAGGEASRMGLKLYLVGGVVRDLLLERTNLDLDLVAEGDAIKLAEDLARLKKGKVIAHSRFNTAKIKWDKWSVDIASARAEGYAKPGALPDVRPSDIQSDLIRRDFTINAMAVYLDPLHYGELIDLYKGREDLERGLIRILHDESFKDDATRIWRAVRYEQRLDFSIEPHTLELLKRDLSYLDTISGDRIRHELELCLEEERPEKVLRRASELGLLKKICPALEAGEWLVKKMSKTRGSLQPFSLPEDLDLAFLLYHLTAEELSAVIRFLKFPHTISQTLLDTISLKNDIPALSASDLPPSQVYHYLHRYTLCAVVANLLATNSSVVRQRLELYLNKLCHTQIELSGEDLIGLGIASGPRIKEILEKVREAKLDGKVSTREEELELAKKMGKWKD